VTLDLRPLAGAGGVLQSQRVQREDQAELLELLGRGLVQAEPDEAGALFSVRRSVEVAIAP
jgi:hypothetical protein